jgi:nitrous oxidase accessory protein NosD
VDPATSAAQELLKLGVPGAVIIFLGLTVYALWRKLGEKDATISALQEARLADVRKCTEALTNASVAMSSAAETNAELQETLRLIAAEYQARRR